MSLTPSNMIELGSKAPDFKLIDVVKNSETTFRDIRGEKGTVVMFICNHCPFVVHVREEILNIANQYLKLGIGFVAISSNDVENYPDDRPELMKKLALETSFPFPYLYDPTQSVAKAYDAACTPDFYLFDSDDNCYYRGRMDKSTPGNNEANNGEDLRLHIDNLLDGKSIQTEQYPSVGCNIKWIE